MHGKATIRYEDDGTILEGNYFNGVLNGKAKLFDDKGNLISVGLYQAGLIIYILLSAGLWPAPNLNIFFTKWLILV